MPAKGTLFFNPSSGPKAHDPLQDAAAAAGLEVLPIHPELDVPALVASRLREGRSLFIAAGGDGTIHMVMQALVNTDATLAVIPAGTFNHFARDLGIPLGWPEALDVALNGETRQIDVGCINGRYFVNNISFGLYPEMVARREERGRDYPRWKARIYAGIATLRKYPHVTVILESEHHQEVVRTHVLLVSNNVYDLSRIGIDAPRGRMTEGRLSVYWLPHLRRIALMKFVAHYLAGRVRQTPGFRSFRTTRMRVQSSRPRLHLGIDGEVVEMEMPLEVTIVPSSLLIKVPR